MPEVLTMPEPAVPTVEQTYLMLPGSQWKKIAIGLGIASSGAVLVYISQVITGIDFGTWTPIAVAVASVLSNIGRKWLEAVIRPV